ncbi:cobyric acid synthase [Candidatus Nitrososphaera gargensis Ga9.2]|uniref:Probable cobyric acid synthase n=1 Tax=Nitrososphaera gargensis (strain Ga9.2) TaxID=1237085 RepID=K0ILF9_NITGG|nr:cobyric acid synthase [Candidatus Nitrososphaera gargensis]AFU57054.1 cobyric acid synthase [Candidatus Nitrososphaera gargensis Ga9.2]
MAKKARLVMVQGTSSGAGKSTIVIGLCRLFSGKGYKVAPFKAQNMSSNFFATAGGAKMALVQAIQAVAARKEPDPLMNPILLKPIGEYRSIVFLNGRFYSEMHAKEYYEKFVMQQGFSTVLKALDSLRSENDIVIMEGAGSPSEINIAKYDIANMLLAQKVGAPVIIVADIERGGCFASIVGTMQLLKPAHRSLVKGFLINQFRGDITLLAPAIKEVQKMTKKRILGVIPKIEFNLPEEDSLVGSMAGKAEIPREAWNWQIDLVAKAIKESVDMERISEVVGL